MGGGPGVPYVTAISKAKPPADSTETGDQFI